MPQQPQVRAKQKRRQTRRLAEWRKKRDAQASAQPQQQQAETPTAIKS
jgi:hypothetical protein